MELWHRSLEILGQLQLQKNYRELTTRKNNMQLALYPIL